MAFVIGKPPILSREWLSQVRIDWTCVLHVGKTRQLGEVLAKHEPVFCFVLFVCLFVCLFVLGGLLVFVVVVVVVAVVKWTGNNDS